VQATDHGTVGAVTVTMLYTCELKNMTNMIRDIINCVTVWYLQLSKYFYFLLRKYFSTLDPRYFLLLLKYIFTGILLLLLK